MNRLFRLLPLYLVLAGCHHTVTEPTIAIEPEVSISTNEPAQTADFTKDSLLSLLIAEIAGQREEFEFAHSVYNSEAIQTKDPNIARRAYFISEYMGDAESALNNAKVWASTAPYDLEAQRVLAIQLAKNGELTESMQIMEQLLQEEGDTNFDFLAISAHQADEKTQQTLRYGFKQLYKKHPDNIQIIYGYALMLEQAGRTERALKLLKRHESTLQLSAPILLHANLLNQLDRKTEALPLLKKAAALHPDDLRIGMSYARLLIETDDLITAREQFLNLLSLYPDDDDIRLSAGLVNLDLEAYEEAKDYFLELIERDTQLDAANFYLGLTEEGLNNLPSALALHKKVTPSLYYISAQQRIMDLLIQLQGIDDAIAYAERQRQLNPEGANELYLIQIEAIKQHEQQPEYSWALVNQALSEYPSDIALLYTRAMLADELDKLPQLEQDLRLILKLEPNNAMAMNALGYTLLERDQRLIEAQQLIEKAHALDPDEPATQDSLGWLYFKLNRLDEAEHWLRKAIDSYPDAEVAAHLAEVLWTNNKKREAQKLLKQFYLENPDSSILLDTIKRLTGKESL